MKFYIKSIIAVALFAISIGGAVHAAENTLWGYYTSQGESLPSVEDRAVIAAELGMFSYQPTAEQNTELLFRLQNPPPPVLKAPEGLLGVSVITNYRSQLRSPMTSSQTTIPVASLLTTDGTTITTNLLDGNVYLTIAPGASNQEIVKCTTVTATDFTGCIRGLAFSGTSESSVSDNRKPHSAGTVVVMSNVHYVFNRLIDGQTTNAQSVASAFTFASSVAFTGAIPTIPTTTPTQDQEVASKAYVDTKAFSTSTSNKVVVDAVAGDTVAENDIVYFDETDDEWKLASATFVDQANYLVGLAMGSGTDGAAIAGGVMTQGIKTGFSGLTPGEPYFLSDTTGDISLSAGTVFFEVGYAQSATQLYFFPKFKSYLTKNQKDALTGTSGTPSNSNRYVTNEDATSTPTASKVVRSSGSITLEDGWLGADAAGDLVYSDGTNMVGLDIGTARQTLHVNSGATGYDWLTKGIIYTEFATAMPLETGEINITTTTIATSTLSEYSGLRISGRFAPTNTSGSNKVYTFRIKYGGTTICTYDSISADNNTGSATIAFECTILYVGTSSQSVFYSAYGRDGSSNDDFVMGGGGTASVNSAATQNLTITAESSIGDLEGTIATILIEVF